MESTQICRQTFIFIYLEDEQETGATLRICCLWITYSINIQSKMSATKKTAMDFTRALKPLLFLWWVTRNSGRRGRGKKNLPWKYLMIIKIRIASFNPFNQIF